MRYYRTVGLGVIAMAAVLFGVARCADAAELPRCATLPEVAQSIKDQKIPPTALSKLIGDDLAQKYIAAADITVPGDTDPVGVLFITTKDIVFTFLVERQGCVRWAIQVPQATHEAAMNKLAAEI